MSSTKSKKYFSLNLNSQRTNPNRNNAGRILGNVLVKVLYLIANVVTLTGLDRLLNKEYMNYGNAWLQWTRLHNTIQYDYLGMRDHPKPGTSNFLFIHCICSINFIYGRNNLIAYNQSTISEFQLSKLLVRLFFYLLVI